MGKYRGNAKVYNAKYFAKAIGKCRGNAKVLVEAMGKCRGNAKS
jgi:hypothetical protein